MRRRIYLLYRLAPILLLIAMTGAFPPGMAAETRLSFASAAMKATSCEETESASCPSAAAEASAPPPFVQQGIGSWYGKKFHGRKTASGERFNMYRMTAAHRTLPFQSYVRVTNLANGKQVVVRINDRGPYARGRIIDVSYAAARALGFVRQGRVRLRLEQLLPEQGMRRHSEESLAVK